MSQCEKCGGINVVRGKLSADQRVAFTPYEGQASMDFAVEASACKDCGSVFDLRVRDNRPYQLYQLAACEIRDLSKRNKQQKAFDALQKNIAKLGLKTTLSDAQKRQLISDTAEGRLEDVAEIVKILGGQ
ncbi:MAG: hypothetical protein FWG14_01610 [Peptococcaceae bacterium]|nr:hypothetical protein [Peptococcaceae bacterium]